MRRKSDLLAEFLIGWAYTFAIAMPMTLVAYSGSGILKILLMTFVFYLLANLLFFNKVSTTVFLSVVATGLLVLTYLCLVGAPESKPVLDAIDGMVGLWYKLAYYQPADKEMLIYQKIFTVIFTAIAAPFTVLFYKKKFNFFIMTGVTFALCFFSWYMTGYQRKWVMILFVLLAVIAYVRYVYTRKKKQGLAADDIPAGNLMANTIPFAVVLLILSSLLFEVKEKPIPWPWLDNRIVSVMEYIEQRFTVSDMDSFKLSSVGFSDRSQRLGGPVRPNGVVAMEVKAVKRTYLRGAAYNWYEDNSWSKIPLGMASTTTPSFDEQFETLNAWSYIPVEEVFPELSKDDKLLLTKLSSGELNDILYPTYQMDVKFRNMRTRTVFTPLKSGVPILSGLSFKSTLTEDYNGIYLAEKKLTSEIPYHLSYIQPMYGEPMLKKALTFSREDLYQEALYALIDKQRGLTKGPVVSVSDIKQSVEKNEEINNLVDLNNRATQIEREYTKLTNTIPKRVGELAASLTKDYNNRYEKVTAIEKYLRTQFKYTYSPGFVPKGRDFVDYFLFDEKKGYCTYFATAMTVMLRSVDIPARYVEGYVLPDNSNSNNVYTVTNKNAHAWVEVYFEGFGWLTFEPTPVYSGVMDYRIITEQTGDQDIQMEEDVEDMVDRYRKDYDDLDSPSVKPAKRTPLSAKEYIKYILISITALFVLTLLINYLAYGIRLWRIRSSGNEKKVILIYEAMLNWIADIGYRIKPGQTVEEFSKRIDRQYSFDDVTFEEVTKIFEEVRYGDHKISREEVRVVTGFEKQLKKLVIKEIGMKRYMPFRYFVMKI